AGFAAKEEIKTVLKALGHTVIDQGTTGESSVDYPDFAEKVARAVVSGEADRGVLLCGTGIGMSIAANKVLGIRAAVIGDEKTAALSRQHNDANVFCAGSRVTPVVKIAESLKVWLQTPFEGGRHQNRVGKISAIEKNR
ncbi:MAG: ribose 5-phosphate isomerase B, partial [Planctomycetota bacterium]